MSRKRNKSRYQRGRSRVLYQMTALVVVLFILSGLAVFFSFINSKNRQIQESKDNLLGSNSRIVSDTYEFINWSLGSMTKALYPDVSSPESVNALLEGQQTPAQGFLNEEFQKIVDARVLGAEVSLAVLMPSAQVPQPVVVASSDEGLIGSWRMPDYLIQAIQDGEPYIYLPDGMPELGLTDETLVPLKNGESTSSNIPMTLVTIVSAHDDVAAINAFYDQQRKDAAIALGIIMLVALVLLTLLSYLGLAYLIRRRITKPIDELSTAAEEVIGGNLDVEIEIHRGEEFEGLKYAFRELLESFRAMLARSMGEEESIHRAERPKPKKGRSRVLYQMTALLVTLFILSELGIFFSFRATQNRQFQEGMNYLMEYSYQDTSDSYDYIYKLFGRLIALEVPEADIAQESRAYMEKRQTPVTRYYSEWLKKMIDHNFLGSSLMFVIQEPSVLMPQPEVYVSSDESLIFNYKIPDYLLQAIDEGSTGLYLPNGIPELGLNDETNAFFKRHEYSSGSVKMKIVYVGMGSRHTKIVAANDFYNKQKRDSTIWLALIMFISAVFLSLLSFFGLRYLIHKRITEPIDELAAAAEEVIGGNLDVEILIRKGEEFEGLKSAFQELLEAFRTTLTMSIGE